MAADLSEIGTHTKAIYYYAAVMSSRALLSALLSTLVAHAQQPLAATPSIRSGGSGVVQITPDLSIVMTSFTSFSSANLNGSPSQATTAVLEVSQSFLESLNDDFGIPEANTTQTSFTNVPHYVLTNDTNPVLVITGWDATVQFTTTSSPSAAANVSGLCSELGGSVNGVNFVASAPARGIAYQQALQLASLDSMARATSMASGLGVTVGMPLYISDTGSSPIPAPYYGLRSMASAKGDSSGFADAGLITVQADVDAAFALIAQNSTRIQM